MFIVPFNIMKSIYLTTGSNSVYDKCPVNETVKKVIDKIDNHKAEIINTEDYSKFDAMLGLRFVAFNV